MTARTAYRYLFQPQAGPANFLLARWLFLRALGLVYASAFFALLFQVRGLIGVHGILPAADYLHSAAALGAARFWYIPSLLWFAPIDRTLIILCWAGLLASILLIANLWPRLMLLLCLVCFLSFVSAAQDFSGFQSDGMLLEAGFLSLFLAPPGLRPGLAPQAPPIRAAWLLLLWEWFRIYFQSGIVKLRSGDPTWRNLTAMYEYYQNGPLPTWIGWYLQHLPHWFHIASAALTLIMELFLVWMALLPRPWRIGCFFLVTAWQAIVIATANYAFLNYLVLFLAILLLDDTFLRRFLPVRLLPSRLGPPQTTAALRPAPEPSALSKIVSVPSAILLAWVFYATVYPLVGMFVPNPPLPARPVVLLEPFRVANQYGLFAVMTPHRYEIEFQGSSDGVHWTSYPFRYKPQDPHARPRIYAPYQPRFDWNLWFASLGPWQQNSIVSRTEELLLEDDPDVLGLFAANPFPQSPPPLVRAVLWQYWFSTPQQRRTEGVWWTRQLLGVYAPTLTRGSDRRFVILDDNTVSPPQS